MESTTSTTTTSRSKGHVVESFIYLGKRDETLIAEKGKVLNQTAPMPSTTISTGTSYPGLSTTFSRPSIGRRPSGRSRTTRATTAATSVTGQDIICAISESRGFSPTVGLAFVNLSTSEAVLCQICDSRTYVATIHKLAVFDPTEILFMNTAKDPQSNLYSIVEENLPELRITTIDRRYWSEDAGQDYVEQLAFQDEIESIKVFLGGNYYATCCLAAV